MNNLPGTSFYSSIKASDIWCFTDAEKYYPTRVNVTTSDDPLSFDVEYVGYGYYWCRIVNTTYFKYYESDRVMFVDRLNSLFGVYVVTFQFSNVDFMKMPEMDMSNYFNEKLHESRSIVLISNSFHYLL